MFPLPCVNLQVQPAWPIHLYCQWWGEGQGCTAKPTTAKVARSPHAAMVLVAPAALEGAHKQGPMSPQMEKPCLFPKGVAKNQL